MGGGHETKGNQNGAQSWYITKLSSLAFLRGSCMCVRAIRNRFS